MKRYHVTFSILVVWSALALAGCTNAPAIPANGANDSTPTPDIPSDLTAPSETLFPAGDGAGTGATPWHKQGPPAADAPDDPPPNVQVSAGDGSDLACSELDPVMRYVACAGACNWVIATPQKIALASDEFAFAKPSGFVVMDTRVSKITVHQVLAWSEPFEDGSLQRSALPEAPEFEVEELPQGFEDHYSGALEGPPTYEYTHWNVSYKLPGEVTLTPGKPLLLGLSTDVARNLIETERPVVTAVFDSDPTGLFDLSRLAGTQMTIEGEKLPQGMVTAEELADLWPALLAELPIKCAPQTADPPAEGDSKSN
jgi:hypothetical protein